MSCDPPRVYTLYIPFSSSSRVWQACDTLVISSQSHASFATNHGSEHRMMTRILNSGFSNSFKALDALGSSCELDETMLSNNSACMIISYYAEGYFVIPEPLWNDHWRIGCGVHPPFLFRFVIVLEPIITQKRDQLILHPS